MTNKIIEQILQGKTKVTVEQLPLIKQLAKLGVVIFTLQEQEVQVELAQGVEIIKKEDSTFLKTHPKAIYAGLFF